MDTNHLIPINNKPLLRENNIHVTPGTLRKWSSAGHNPQLFLKICNRLHVDVNEWNKLVDAAKVERSERIERLRKLDLL